MHQLVPYIFVELNPPSHARLLFAIYRHFNIVLFLLARHAERDERDITSGIDIQVYLHLLEGFLNARRGDWVLGGNHYLVCPFSTAFALAAGVVWG